MASGRISVRVEPALQEQVEIIARSTGKSESQLVREALAEYCKKYGKAPTAYDLAQECGIIGLVKKAPKDLSTNPKYMEGFGRG